jgi:hypothetical protein
MHEQSYLERNGISILSVFPSLPFTLGVGTTGPPKSTWMSQAIWMYTPQRTLTLLSLGRLCNYAMSLAGLSSPRSLTFPPPLYLSPGKMLLLEDLSIGDCSWSRLFLGGLDGLFRFTVNATNNSLPTGDHLCRGTRYCLASQCSVLGLCSALSAF